MPHLSMTTLCPAASAAAAAATHACLSPFLPFRTVSWLTRCQQRPLRDANSPANVLLPASTAVRARQLLLTTTPL